MGSSEDPPAQGRRANTFLAAGHELILADLILAEVVYVLESYHAHPRTRSPRQPGSSGRPSVAASDYEFLLPAIELYEVERLDFADAYVCAVAELLVSEPLPPSTAGIERASSIRRVGVDPRVLPGSGMTRTSTSHRTRSSCRASAARRWTPGFGCRESGRPPFEGAMDSRSQRAGDRGRS